MDLDKVDHYDAVDSLNNLEQTSVYCLFFLSISAVLADTIL